MKLHPDPIVRGLRRAYAFYKDNEGAQETSDALYWAISKRINDIEPVNEVVQELNSQTRGAILFANTYFLHATERNVRASLLNIPDPVSYIASKLKLAIIDTHTMFWRRVESDRLSNFTHNSLHQLAQCMPLLGDLEQVDWRAAATKLIEQHKP